MKNKVRNQPSRSSSSEPKDSIRDPFPFGFPVRSEDRGEGEEGGGEGEGEREGDSDGGGEGERRRRRRRRRSRGRGKTPRGLVWERFMRGYFSCRSVRGLMARGVGGVDGKGFGGVDGKGVGGVDGKGVGGVDGKGFGGVDGKGFGGVDGKEDGGVGRAPRAALAWRRWVRLGGGLGFEIGELPGGIILGAGGCGDSGLFSLDPCSGLLLKHLAQTIGRHLFGSNVSQSAIVDKQPSFFFFWYFWEK